MYKKKGKEEEGGIEVQKERGRRNRKKKITNYISFRFQIKLASFMNFAKHKLYLGNISTAMQNGDVSNYAKGFKAWPFPWIFIEHDPCKRFSLQLQIIISQTIYFLYIQDLIRISLIFVQTLPRLLVLALPTLKAPLRGEHLCYIFKRI